MNQTHVPTIKELLASPQSSDWLRKSLISAMTRDPVDAAHDAEMLAQILSSGRKKCCPLQNNDIPHKKETHGKLEN